MTKGNTRIRWTEDERNSVLAAYRTLHAHEPHRDVAKLFDRAQKALPAKRRRALDYKLRVWLKSDGMLSRGPTAANAVGTTPTASARPIVTKKSEVRPKARDKSVPTGAALSSTAPLSRDSVPAAVSASASDSVVLALIVERGSEIVADILSSERVRQALRVLLSGAWPGATTGAVAGVPLTRDGVATADGEAGATAAALPENGKLRVLIAGMDKREGATLAKTYDDTLELACWSADEGLELLPAAVARADVVVGMTSLLSQPVEQTLRRHARRYLRNARGVAGLRGELANLALSGRVVTGEGGVAQQA